MPVTGPTFAGGATANNALSVAFKPSQQIPAGALLFVPFIIDNPDTTTVSVADANPANVYNQQAGAQDPNSSHTLFVFVCKVATAISTSQNITVTLGTRSQCAAGAVFYTGLGGTVRSMTTQWDNTTTPTIVGFAPDDGDTILALMAVSGPTSDAFTQDSRWGTDFMAGVGTNSFSVHGGGRSAPTRGNYDYAPTLGTLRRASTMLASMQ